ncbi:signal peptide peptidase-like 5 isoform X2 [Cucumis melo var. makuwa]|uniref:Signal peptide peptidase-like 5 isoform X2 n=1 Tax=Cucumis melo var. makuwa TaxID=1194695 RepID=A0A5D3BRL0_CUCMM|nr:signal peptide peptidase-like 5 isoform X2 [Cucumis melo var. makuwa]
MGKVGHERRIESGFSDCLVSLENLVSFSFGFRRNLTNREATEVASLLSLLEGLWIDPFPHMELVFDVVWRTKVPKKIRSSVLVLLAPRSVKATIEEFLFHLPFKDKRFFMDGWGLCYFLGLWSERKKWVFRSRMREHSKVKVKSWVNDAEDEIFVGLSARFGTLVPSQAEDDLKLPAVYMNPTNGCSSSSSKLSGSIALSIRGECDFTIKAEIAQAGGAAALLVINDKEDLYKMVCSEKDTALNISIPVVMLPKSSGDALNKLITDGKSVKLLLYAPKRPVVDFSVVFLWMMAVGTVACATLWSEITAVQTEERYNELSPKESSNPGGAKDDSEDETLDINVKSAIVFVITASSFLVLLYFFMSSWFVWLLIVMFCIGGVEVPGEGYRSMGKLRALERFLEFLELGGCWRPEILNSNLRLSLEADLLEILRTKERNLLQKSKLTWLMLGDENTSFLHRFLAAKKRRNLIPELINDRCNPTKKLSKPLEFSNLRGYLQGSLQWSVQKKLQFLSISLFHFIDKEPMESILFLEGVHMNPMPTQDSSFGCSFLPDGIRKAGFGFGRTRAGSG